MSGSKEELIDMVELTSPNKKSSYPKIKKRNKIHSPPFVSPVRNIDKDVTSLFSVRKSPKESSFEDDTETISEFSDDVVSEQSMKNVSKSESVATSNRSKNRISQKMNKLKMSFEKIRRESSEIDDNIKSVRSRLSLEKPAGKPEFAFFTSTSEEPAETYDEDPLPAENYEVKLKYFLPENLCFNIALAEKDNFFVPLSRSIPITRKLVDEEPRILGEEGLYVNSNMAVPKNDLNILEQRLLSTEDKKWFNCEGNVIMLPTPLIDRSIKPDIEIRTGEGLVYSPPQQHLDMEEVLVVKEQVLELSLFNMKCSHHPLFSLEHVLQEKLHRAFQQYSSSVENNTLQKLRNQLEALKHAKKLKSGDVTFTEIKKLREDLFIEGKMQRDGLKIILDVWKSIKKIRQEQKYCNTSVRLVIKKDKSIFSEEKAAYQKFFVDTLQDILEEHRNIYKMRLKEYTKKINAKGEEISNVKSDSDEMEDTELEKPIYDIDEKKIESELRAKFEESFKPPGEPNLTLLLKNDNEISRDVDNDLENARRKVVLSTKFTLKILCNGILVCKSKPVNLNDNFILDINESFSIQLTDIPKCLCISINEHPKGLLKKKICELDIDVPRENVSSQKSKLTKVDFEKKEIVHYKHAGVGSGYDIKKMMEEREVSLDIKMDTNELNTAGFLSYRIGWHTYHEESSNLALPNDWQEYQIPNVIDKWGGVDENQLELWLEGRRPDPQDPKNSAFFEYLEIKNAGGGQRWKQKDKEYFRLNPYIGSMIFCNMEELNQNIRLQYLKLRDQNEIEFDGMVVPNRIREISFSLLKDFKRRKALEAIEDDDFQDDLETLRDTGKRHLKQIHTRIFQMCKGVNDNLTYESVVDEKYLIYFDELIKTSLKNVLNWFRWQPRVSKPLPRITKKDSNTETQQVHKTQISQNKILIKILSGKNIPKTKSKKIDGDFVADREVRPFLEITYDDFFTRTSVLAGSDVSWNELVTLPLKYHHSDYLNPNALNGSISIDLFDLIETDEELNGDTDKKFWLGEIKIPLSALTTGLNLNGWFKVKTPPILLGYEINDDQFIPKSPKLTNIQNLPANDTYIELNLHISPNIPLLEPNMADLPCNDIPYINDHVTKWNEIFNSSFPNKKFCVLALDTNGRTNCITRYIRPLEPPQLNTEEFDVTPEQCLRYVSLIPFTECNPFYQNLWLKTEQLLNFMIGSAIDHCVALTCFLLALKMEAYLLLGYGIPQGSTAYVLLYEYSRESDLPAYVIFDVVYNKMFYLSDPLCPLQRVYCLVNGENVWGNTQRTQNPALLRFDLTRRSDWWALFNNVVPAPTNVINNKINFALAGDSQQIERQLERKIKRKISKWRPMDRTTFNHRLSESFKNALRFFELNAMYGRSNTEAVIELNKANSQYNMSSSHQYLKASSSKSVTILLGDIEHLSQLSENLSSLCLSLEYSDVTLVVEGQKLYAHKVILAARSDYFRALLYGGLKESNQAEIILPDAPLKAFKILLKYIYTGHMFLMTLKEDVILDTLGLAHQYGFEELESAISDILKQLLALRNVCPILDTAHLYGLEKLVGVCHGFLDKHASEILSHESFTTLSQAALVELLQRDSFFAPEVEIFRGVCNWCKVNEDLNDRAMKCVRLPLMSVADLLSVVRPAGLVKPDALLDAIADRTNCRIGSLPHRGQLVVDENVACPRTGSKVVAGELTEFLLDGDYCTYDMDKGYTRHAINGPADQGIIVKLGVPSIINHIRMLLWDRDIRSYSYYVEVSMEQKDWVRVVDYSQYCCRSWQCLYFDTRVVQYIRIVGTHNTVNKVFHLVTFECMYKQKMPKMVNDIISPNYNVATLEKSAVVIEGVSRARNALLNGDTKQYDWDSGYTCHQLGSGAILIQLGQPYIISNLRLLLWDCDDRSYSYYIESSVNIWEWEMVVDNTRESCKSWQVIRFPPRPVVFIRIVGTHNTANEVFHCVHFECPSCEDVNNQTCSVTVSVGNKHKESTSSVTSSSSEEQTSQFAETATEAEEVIVPAAANPNNHNIM